MAAVNNELAELLEHTGLSHAALARHVVHLGATQYGLRLAYDYRSVGRWLRGAVPDPPGPQLLAAVFTRLTGRTVTVHQLGFAHGDTIRSKRLSQRLDEFAARLASHKATAAVADYLDVDKVRTSPGAI